MRILTEKEEELDEVLQKHIKIAVISKTKKSYKELQYSRQWSYTKKRAQSGSDAMDTQKLIKMIQHNKFWNDRITEARFKINRGHLTILQWYTLEEGKIEEADKFYKQL